MTATTYLRGGSPRLARAAVFCLLALVATLLQAREARAQWTTSGNTTSTTNSVGVGTSAPEQSLHVHGSSEILSTGSGSGFKFRDRNSTSAADDWVWYSQGNIARFWRAGTGDMLGVTTAGNVGIGTLSPTAKLDVVQANSTAVRALSGSITSHVNIQIGRVGSEASLGVAAGPGQYTNDASEGDIILRTEDIARRLLFSNGPGASALAVAGGRVGVGTANPAYQLDVVGAINASASGGLCIAGDCKTSWSQVGGSQWATSGSSLLYNLGSVGIATQAPTSAKLVIGGTAGAEGLDLATSDQYANLRVIRNSKSSFDKDLYLQYGAGAGSRIRFYNDNAESMTLAGGNLGVGTTAPQAKLDVQGDIRVSGNINAKYQDVAEWVPSKQKLQAGTVVVLDTAELNHVQASASSYDTGVAGVVSAQPGISLGDKGEGKLLVATTGRVKVKVDATRAPIRVGDLLVTSDVAGVAMKSQPLELGGVPIHRPGTIIGKALEPLEKGVGEILVLLSLQ
jgi:hypothetical protein